ncbi:MAG: hypothetical protein Q7S40_06335 [Opitutaceae bacterium]|nr:hypothetical protein [Opitutaceae bacterium]
MRSLSARFLVAFTLIATSAMAAGAAGAAPRYPYRMLISDMLSEKILILEKDGSASWELEQPGWVMDGEQLANGNVLYCWYEPKKAGQSGVREVTPGKQVVFEYKISQECHSVQRLPDGLTLIGDPSNQRLIEVDRQGKIVRELKLQVGDKHVHRVSRQCRKLANGNYLVAQTFDQAVVEYAPDGSIVRRFSHPGMTYGVSRLANGNTLIGTGGGPGPGMGKRAVEMDPQGKIVWSFNPEDFPAETNLDWVLGVQRLPSGNTVIVNFLGHGKDGQGISILEVTPQKRIVWTYREPRIMLLMQLLP